MDLYVYIQVNLLIIDNKKHMEDSLTDLLNRPLTAEQLKQFNTHVDVDDLIYTHYDKLSIQNLMDEHKLNTYQSALMIAIVFADHKHGKAAAITFNVNNWSLSKHRMNVIPGITTDSNDKFSKICRKSYFTGQGGESIGANYDAICNIIITTDSNAIVELQPVIWFDDSNIPTILAESNGYHHIFANITRENPICWNGDNYFGLKFVSSSPISKSKCTATAIIYSDMYHGINKNFLEHMN